MRPGLRTGGGFERQESEQGRACAGGVASIAPTRRGCGAGDRRRQLRQGVQEGGDRDAVCESTAGESVNVAGWLSAPYACNWPSVAADGGCIRGTFSQCRWLLLRCLLFLACFFSHRISPEPMLSVAPLCFVLLFLVAFFLTTFFLVVVFLVPIGHNLTRAISLVNPAPDTLASP